MKIAMVGQFPPHFGGVGVHIHTLSKKLVEEGHEVYVITYPHKNIKDIDGIHVIPTKGINIPGVRGLMFKKNAKKALENLVISTEFHESLTLSAIPSTPVLIISFFNALLTARMLSAFFNTFLIVGLINGCDLYNSNISDPCAVT